MKRVSLSGSVFSKILNSGSVSEIKHNPAGVDSGSVATFVSDA